MDRIDAQLAVIDKAMYQYRQHIRTMRGLDEELDERIGQLIIALYEVSRAISAARDLIESYGRTTTPLR